MSELIKKPYKISLWEDEQIYLIKDKGADDSARYETTTLPESGYDLLNKYVRENCLAIIGSNTMDTPIRAFEPKLVRQTNGTNTLTFQIFYRYYDEDDECFKLNPFTNLLVNERKVKLFYDGEWFDFVIKQIQEDSQKYTFTYTCQDLYISELAKNGYNLVFDTELENNMGTITELAEVILDGTDWQVGESDFLEQRNEEVLYTYEVENTLKAAVLENLEYGLESWTKGQEVEIPQGSIIFICRSSYIDRRDGDNIQFFWRSDGKYITDDDNNIINSPNFMAPAPSTLWNETTQLKVTSDYRGKYLVSSVRTHYIPQIDKHCYNYIKDGIEYYAYIGSEFISFDSAENLITNYSGFISTNGWYGINDGTVSSTVALGDDLLNPSLAVNFNTAKKIGNTGIYDSKALLNEYGGFVSGDRYVLVVKSSNNSNITGADICYTPNSSEVGTAETSIVTCTTRTESDSRLSGYKTFTLICSKSLSYTEIVLSNLSFYLKGNGSVNLIDVKLFKEVYADGKLIIPDLEEATANVIKDRYYFFKKSQITDEVTSIDDITFDTVCLKEEIASNGYVLADEPTYEKITSITASKSNRFNLIQELCEAFECWARFEIEHNTIGATVYEYVKTSDTAAVDGKKYYSQIGTSGTDMDYKYTNFSKNAYERILHKEVVFKEYIGKENYAGFRYGINLKSISRSVDTKQIVTKLIVEPNSNEFGLDGFCTIQRSVMNPTGENIIYNFQYYLNNGLIDKEELYNDFYDENKGIGLYNKLNQYNKQNSPLIQQQSEISITLAKAIARQQTYKHIIEEATTKRKEYIKNIEDGFTKLKEDVPSTSLPSDYSTVKANNDNYSSFINENIRQRDTATATINKYTPLKTNMDALVKKYQKEYITVTNTLSAASQKTNELNNEFFKKYSRYVQEGTWISEDYFDDDLYFLDACEVGRTSAFPQVSYTINVIEISGIEEYKNYNFEVGDKTYIEDTEFFGYVPGTKRPYQEEVIISEVSYSLDNPANNTIKVQNYKTRFEDLFQRVAAATQSLQYHEGKYDKASNVVKEDGTIDGSVLEKTLNFNFCLSDAISKEISEGGEVINLTSITSPNRIIQLNGLGIQLSNNGGLNWQTAITADGINADVGVFGSLHTKNLRIYNGDEESFYWDANGLTAYQTGPNGGVIVNKFVRMDKWGIYGYAGNTAKTFYPQKESDVINNSIFSLTWNGLNLKSLNGSNYIGISATHGGRDGSEDNLRKVIWAGKTVDGKEVDNFIVYEDGTIKANNGHFEGTIKATGGEFKGTVNADGFLIKGKEALTSNGLIKAGVLEVDAIKVKAANITGTLTVGQVENAAAKSDIPSRISQLFNDSDFQDATGVTSIVEGTITTDYINALGITVNAANITGVLAANKIKLGGEMTLYLSTDLSDESVVGNFGAVQGNIGGNRFTGVGILSYDTSVLGSYDDDVLIISPNDTMITTGNNLNLNVPNFINVYSQYLVPKNSGVTLCGSYSYQWKDGYFDTLHVNGSEITGSDKNLKENINYNIDKYLSIFDNLKPCSYKYIKGKRTHLGMIAQEVESAIINSGLDLNSYAAVCIDKDSKEYGLRYSEFIPLLIAKVQQLDGEMKNLKKN